MPTKARTRSRILEAVHETTTDLHRLGFIDKRKRQKLAALRIEPAQPRTAKNPGAARPAQAESGHDFKH